MKKQIADLANKAALFKLKKEDFVRIVANSVDFESSYLRGLANTYATGIRKSASSYGITLPDGSKELKNLVKDKFTGAMSDDDITANHLRLGINCIGDIFRGRSAVSNIVLNAKIPLWTAGVMTSGENNTAKSVIFAN